MEGTSAMADGPNKFVVIRDSVLLGGGMAGIAFQQITGQINPLLIGVYVTMLGLPGLSSGRWLLKQIGEAQSSESRSSASASDSSPPSGP
jgi:hypothetical protein